MKSIQLDGDWMILKCENKNKNSYTLLFFIIMSKVGYRWVIF